jgi:elongation factor P
MITPNDFYNGLIIRYKNEIWEVIEFGRVKIAQRRAFVRTKLKNLLSGRVIEENFASDENIEDVAVERKRCQYLYNDGEVYHFMELESFEQFGLSKEVLGEKIFYLTENLELDVIYIENRPFTVVVPTFVVLRVVETEPDFKGDTASGGGKPARLETGLVVNVPFFINVGNLVRIDTRDNSYVERVA